ncbi:MAG: NAD(+)/NADH kinase [Defluviitaleaceae bacterium]|nr:NAD(+)/NADH kinase [Defluviitaleaceae bacterium]
MKRIAFFTNPYHDEGLVLTQKLKQFVCQFEHTISDIGDADYIVVLGGDGTMLAAARASGGTPLLGINLGNVGYLTDAQAAQGEQAIEKLLSGNFQIQTRMMLEAAYTGGQAVLALNDIVIHRGHSPRPIRCHIAVNGERMDEFNADGIVVSTPTGSTAYNLSAGGPLLKPDARMIAITPICAHSASARPAVVSHEDTITISIQNPQDIIVTCDGERVFDNIECGNMMKIDVRTAKQTTQIVKTHSLSFYELFRTKMT